jgi:hypothetical protein
MARHDVAHVLLTVCCLSSRDAGLQSQSAPRDGHGSAGDAMSEHQDARDMLDRAERAAEAGDLASADELLRRAARTQEDALGPLHPDLANTLNNLAVVAERTGRPSEAEAFYRRAVAIASASLPSEHPMVVASRQNLEGFCRARGLSIDAPEVIAPTQDAVVGSDVSAGEHPAPEASAPAAMRTDNDGTTAGAAPPLSAEPTSSAAPPSVPRQPATRPTPPLPAAPTPGRGSHLVAWMAIGAVVLVAAVLLVSKPWSTRGAPRPAPAEAVPPPRDTSPAGAAPIVPAGPPKAAPRRDDRTAATGKAAPAPTPGAGMAAITQLCRTLSMSNGNWRCDPAGNSVAPGRLVLYTRIRSPRNAVVEHRWYRGDTLRQSVRLAIQANPTEGYRTYSRQTVDAGDWRVEVRSADGRLLHEQRFSVR